MIIDRDIIPIKRDMNQMKSSSVLHSLRLVNPNRLITPTSIA